MWKILKKVLLAINNKKLEKNIRNNLNFEIINSNLQYREGILELLEKQKNIDIIFIDEKLPGIISIEKLIKEIKKKMIKLALFSF